MWYPATITVAASAEPVSVEAARWQCGIADGDTATDAQLTLLIAAARREIETYCGIRLPVQTVRVPCDGFDDLARLPEAPVKSVVGIHYVDSAGASQQLDSATYEERLDGLWPSIVLASGCMWPAIRPGSRLIVEMVVGYDSLPEDLEVVLLMKVSAHYTFAGKDLTVRRDEVEGVGSTQYGGIIEVNQAVNNAVQKVLESYRCWPLA